MIKKYEKLFSELTHQKPTVLRITDNLMELLYQKEMLWELYADEDNSLVDVAFRKFEIEKLYQHEDCFVFTVR